MGKKMEKYARSWNLYNIFPDIKSVEFKKAFKYIEDETINLTNECDKLPDINEEKTVALKWENFFKKLENFKLESGLIAGYVNNKISKDVENEKLMILMANLSSILIKAAPVEIKILSKLKKCEKKTYNTFINNSNYLKKIKFSIDENKKHSNFLMDEKREKLSADLSIDGIHAWSRLYDKISGKLKIELMEKGSIVKKSVSQIRYDSNNRSIRQNEFFASLKSWDTVKDICADALNHIAGTRLTLYKEKGFKHFLDETLLKNRLKRESLNAMWSSVSERKSMFIPFFKSKAKIMGVKKLSWYDISAPIVSGKIDFDCAMDIIIKEYGNFNHDMGNFVKWCIDNKFIESENCSGKRAGAYCMQFAKKNQPRIFMTFTDNYASMSILAHELGHAYHNYILKDEPLSLRKYPMGLAETASTFGEAIIGNYLLKNAQTDNEKAAMLDKKISDAVLMLMNIHSRFIFECNFYEKRSYGELTSDQLTEIMVSAQKEAYLELLEDYDPLFWASKLHFYMSNISFYNFPYTFGYLFSNALLKIYKEQGKKFAKTYNKILIDTGCMNTEELLFNNLGTDITKKEFWNKSLDLIEDDINQFIKITDKK